MDLVALILLDYSKLSLDHPILPILFLAPFYVMLGYILYSWKKKKNKKKIKEKSIFSFVALILLKNKVN